MTTGRRRLGKSPPPSRRRLLELLEKFDGLRLAVCGDLVLDEFVYGEIARVSREAPVLILEHRESRFAPGGAANAVANVRALGGQPAPVGRVGTDEASELLIGLLGGQGIDCSLIVRDPAHATPTKSRILAGSPHTAKQQVVRIDRGNAPVSPSRAVRAGLGLALARALRGASGLLVADYGYGAVDPAGAELGRCLREKRCPVVVDSRFRILEFRGVTAATPNIAEVEAALGARLPDDDLAAIERAGARLLARLGARALLLTRGSHGLSVFARGGTVEHVPAFGSDEVTDVTGAGDTVAATFTLALVAGASALEAAVLANVAGGIVVTKRGTATVSRSELASALESGA